MRVIITRPKQTLHLIEKRLLQEWDKLAHSLGAQSLEVFEAHDYETHGDLLNRIWNDVRHEKFPFVISESDFSPDENGIHHLYDRITRWERAACFTSCVRFHEKHLGAVYSPLVSPAFMILDPSRTHADLPLFWLGAAGPWNDAAAAARILAAGCGAILDADAIILEPKLRLPPHPRSFVCEAGVHYFWTRHWNDVPHVELLPGYTVAEHLVLIRRELKL